MSSGRSPALPGPVVLTALAALATGCGAGADATSAPAIAPAPAPAGAEGAGPHHGPQDGHEHGKGHGPGHEHGKGHGPGHEHGKGHGPGHEHGKGHGPGHEHGKGHAQGAHGAHGGPLVHRFERADEWVRLFDDPARDAWQKPAGVIAAMKIAPGMTVADLGAGTGYFLPHLSRAVGPAGVVLALDVEADMVRHMTERAAREKLANVKPQQVPFDDPGLAPGSVDRILIVDTWHHIPDRPRYAAKLEAALRPGGAVVIVDFTRDAKQGPPPAHRILPEDAAAELRAGGLAPEIAAEDLPDQYIVLGRRLRP